MVVNELRSESGIYLDKQIKEAVCPALSIF